MLKIKDIGGVPLESVIRLALLEEGILSKQNDRTPDVLHNPLENGTMKEFYTVLNRHNGYIDSLIEANRN